MDELVHGIGSVMPAQPGGPPDAGNILDVWRTYGPAFSAFSTARSALAALLRHERRTRVWLPAYICESLVHGAGAAAEVQYYPVGERLRPDFGQVASALRPGDAIVTVAYFGFPAPIEDEILARFDDILWIEDRAQALDAGPSRADALLFSPRKLVGVGDGGLIVANRPLPRPTEAAQANLWAPEDARALDPAGEHPERWYPLFQEREEQFHVDERAASTRTLEALAATPIAPMADKRRSNWRTLAAALPDHALWPELTPTAPPLALPIVTADAQDAQRRLAAERIWAPRHWSRLPSSAAEFPREAALSERLVSLPCDHRYDEADMLRIVEAVKRTVRPYPR